MLEIPKQRFGELAGVERVQVLDPLPDGDELDGHPDLVGYGEGYAALSRPVELGEDDPRDPRDLVEHPSLPQAILPRRGIYSEQDLVRRAREPTPDNPPYLVQLGHEVDLGVEPSRRVYEQHVHAVPLGCLDSIVGDGRRVRAALPRDYRSPGPLSPSLQLLYGRRPEGVPSGEHGLARKEVDQLADGRGLARTVD